ncbi:MAG: porphobilinogen synthase [Waddliaceae bacterium]|nr:porphobilinogen synthase [Waddliaceae bacterium]
MTSNTILSPKTTTKSLNLLTRPRRNRKSAAIRSLVQENRLHPSDFVLPLFAMEGNGIEEPVLSMPGVFRQSLDKMLKTIERACYYGIPAIELFSLVPEELKDISGSESLNPNGLQQRAVREIKKEFPHLCVMADVALDPFTSTGHDGVVNEKGIILNDESVSILADFSVSLAEAGVDVVAPSDMMDGRIEAIRQALDLNGFFDVSILSYTMKYASAFYGPFRDALNSAPKFGDKKTYQANPANSREALIEAELDEAEGADLLLVKPGIAYLDILAKIRAQTALPLGVYQVSGEYAMIKAAAEKGWINGEEVMMESLMSFKRAGADFIFTYSAIEACEYLKNQ